MGLFKNLLKKDEITVGAPLEGEVIPLKEVSDPTFRDGYLGDGIAIKPSGDIVYAPVDGTVSTVFRTGHAVGINTDDHVELLIHIGIDTVELGGKHFEMQVKEGQTVKRGEQIGKADMEQIKAAGYQTVTPVTVTNSTDFSSIEGLTGKTVNPGDDVITIKKK